MTFDNCPLCTSRNIRYRYSATDRHYNTLQESHQVFKCDFCSLFFINPQIEANKLHSLYSPKDYYAYKGFATDRRGLYSILKVIRRILIGTNHLVIPELKANKKILDLGCGTGEALFSYKKKGMEVHGVEIDKSACDYGNSYGLNIHYGTLEQAGFPDEYFAIVRSNHSLEHITNPWETLKEISRILKKNGYFFIGVPNTNSIPFKIFRKYWFYLGVPFHPFNYNLKNLKILLSQHGLTVIKKRHVGNFLGVSGSIQIFLNRNTIKTSNQGVFSNLFLQVISHQFARLFNLFNTGDCIEILAQKR
jgi:SAM-dependent methyltransferase